MSNIKKELAEKKQGKKIRLEKLKPDGSVQNQTKETIAASEVVHRAIFEQAVDSIVLFDAETGEFVLFNDSTYKNLGYTKEEFQNLKIPDFEDIESAEQVTEHISKIVRQGSDIFETRHRTKDGQIRNIQVSSKAVTIGGKKFIQAIWRDITKIRQAEEELRLHSEIMANISEGIVLTNARDAVIVYTNPKFDKMFGYRPGELIAKNISIVNAPDTARPDDIASKIQQSLRQYGSWRGEIKNIKKDGTPFWCYVNVSTFKHNDYGEVWVAVHTDITERKRAEEQILLANERLQYLLSSTSAVIYTSKTSGDYGATFISDNVREMTGYEQQDFIGKPNFWLNRIHPEDIKRVIKKLRNIFEKDRYAYEYRFRHKDDRYIWVRDEMKLVRDRNGNPLEIIGYWIDITDRKRTEQSLLESEKLAAKGQMAAQIAHELNNPLAGIKNSLLLIEGAVNKNNPYYRYLGLINKEIDRLAQIVRQMFELYRPTGAEVTEFAVDDTISEVVTLLESSCRQYKVLVNIKKSRCSVKLPEALLRQVLYNIIKNAIEASSVGGLVKITPKTSGKVLTITVSDQGDGIPEDVKSHIFEPAFTTKKNLKTGGLGLGLSVSKSIIEEMAGNIEFESKEGQGTAFRIIIPFDKSAEKTKDD